MEDRFALLLNLRTPEGFEVFGEFGIGGDKLGAAYVENKEFVGADMAQKYLQIGYTRARRYANYKGGKKYDKSNDYVQLERGTGDVEKVEAAQVFYAYWKKAEGNEHYAEMKKRWKHEKG